MDEDIKALIKEIRAARASFEIYLDNLRKWMFELNKKLDKLRLKIVE
ncbi:MAG: hypothetical protein FWE38_04140 [Firmicutes bacterium]|nr:hypothetical protein [Bacillota bacterium]